MTRECGTGKIEVSRTSIYPDFSVPPFAPVISSANGLACSPGQGQTPVVMTVRIILAHRPMPLSKHHQALLTRGFCLGGVWAVMLALQHRGACDHATRDHRGRPAGAIASIAEALMPTKRSSFRSSFAVWESSRSLFGRRWIGRLGRSVRAVDVSARSDQGSRSWRFLNFRHEKTRTGRASLELSQGTEIVPENCISCNSMVAFRLRVVKPH